jgi:hypothetical protein
LGREEGDGPVAHSAREGARATNTADTGEQVERKGGFRATMGPRLASYDRALPQPPWPGEWGQSCGGPCPPLLR